jgi:hypothetical protein
MLIKIEIMNITIKLICQWCRFGFLSHEADHPNATRSNCNPTDLSRALPQPTGSGRGGQHHGKFAKPGCGLK